MKYWWIILILIVALAAIILYNKLKKNISFDFNIAGNASDILGLLQSRYDLSQRSQNKAGLYFDIPITTFVKNNGAAKVVMENIAGSISYEGEPILQTKAASPQLAKVEVGKKSSKPVTDNVQLLINESTIKFFKELVKGKMPKIFYDFSSMIGGKTKRFSNNTQVNKPEEPQFDEAGNPVNPNLQTRCSSNCLTPYPEGSQYYGYYYCKSNCASFI